MVVLHHAEQSVDIAPRRRHWPATAIKVVRRDDNNAVVVVAGRGLEAAGDQVNSEHMVRHRNAGDVGLQRCLPTFLGDRFQEWLWVGIESWKWCLTVTQCVCRSQTDANERRCDGKRTAGPRARPTTDKSKRNQQAYAPAHRRRQGFFLPPSVPCSAIASRKAVRSGCRKPARNIVNQVNRARRDLAAVGQLQHHAEVVQGGFGGIDRDREPARRGGGKTALK